jgi:alpha-glucosidase
MRKCNKHVVIVLFLLVTLLVSSARADILTFPRLDGERYWGGNITDAHNMPYGEGAKVGLYESNAGNQQQPMLVSNHGFWLYSDDPFTFEITPDSLIVESDSPVLSGRSDNKTLPGAYRELVGRMHNFEGEIPDPIMFTQPQWNTWIEFGTNQTAAGLLDYAESVRENDFPGSLIMVDDKWQTEYGDYDFDTTKFPNPKETLDRLHKDGFQVMLWVVPFVHDTARSYPFLKENGYLLRSEKTGDVHFIKWWNGEAALLDLTNPDCMEWFVGQLKMLQKNYGVDGFKLDGGDIHYYSSPDIIAYDPKAGPHDHSVAFAEVGLHFPLNEYRACYGLGGAPLAQRLRDKRHDWPSVELLIPHMAAEGIWGYPFCCPDMIGGGEINSLSPDTPKDEIDGELVVRGAQVHALMPMMQFSVAPWRILNDEHLQAVRDAAKLHEKFGSTFLELARQSAATGEPILRCMEYNYPHQGYIDVNDQFMIGEKILVAPVITQGSTSRQVRLPGGTWIADDGQAYDGLIEITIDVPLNRLPYFTQNAAR